MPDNTNNNNPPIVDDSSIIKVWVFEQRPDGSLTPSTSGIAPATSVKIEDSSGNALDSNGSGSLNVEVVGGTVVASNPSVGVTGSAAPASATEIGVIDGFGNLQGASTSHPVPVSIVSGELSTVTVVQPTGANLHTVIDTGSNTIGKIDILGNAGAVLDEPVASATQAPNIVQVGGWVTTGNPTYVTATQQTFSFTTSGGARTDITSVAGTALTAVPSTFGSAPTGSVQGNNASIFAGTTSVPAGTFGTTPGAASGTLPVNASLYIGTTALTTTGVSGQPKVGIVGATGVTLDAVLGAAKPANVLQVGGNDGTNAYGIPLASGGASVAVTGTVAVTQSTSPWITAGNLTNNNAAPVANNIGVLPAVASTAAPTYTTADQVLLSVDLSGRLRSDNSSWAGTTLGAPTNFGTTPTAVVAASANVSLFCGTTAISNATAGTPDVALTRWGGTALGTPTNFGTTPTAVIAGSVNASLFIGTTAVRTNQTTTAAGVQDVNIVGSLGVTNSVTNGSFFAITDNTTKAGVIAATTALKTDQSSQAGTAITTVPVAFGTGAPSGNAPGVNSALFVGTTAVRSNQTTTATGAVDVNNVGIDGTTIVTAAAGVQRVGIAGNANATLDAVITAATAPANGVAVLSVNQTTAPSLTVGQSVAQQCDYQGSVFVKPFRRGQTTAKATTIAATVTATTVLAAQAAGIFADISHLVITPIAGATSNTGFTCTLSDGTNNYIFDLFTGSLATVTDTPTNINITFNPPLPATTAATAWTIANSSATPTVHVTVVAVLQKAS